MTEEHLLVRDRDTREDTLKVEVQMIPRHGRLELQGRTLLQGDAFTLQDLRGLRLRLDLDPDWTETKPRLDMVSVLVWTSDESLAPGGGFDFNIKLFHEGRWTLIICVSGTFMTTLRPSRTRSV